MRTLLRKFFRWLFPESDRSEIPSLEELKAELHLRKRAIANGRKELPPSDSTRPDEVEGGIRERLAREKRKIDKKYELQRESLRGKLARLQSGTGVADIKSQVIGAVTDFKVAADQTITDLYVVYRRAEGHQNALKIFREKNKLTAPASYPDSQLLYWGIIGIILVIEIALSAYFFSQGHSMGYLGGVSLAVAVSVCNIGLTIVASLLLLRQLFHRNWLRRIFFGAIYGLTLACVVLINFFFAHVRDVMSAPNFFADNPTGAVPVQAIVHTLLSGSFALQSLDSYLFLGITTFFCLIAIIDVYKMDDPYPGYGRRERHFERAYEDWVDQKEQSLSNLATSRDRKIQAVEGFKDQLHEKSMLQTALLQNAHDISLKQTQLLHLLIGQEQELVDFYRSLNRASRKTPPPTYFDEQTSEGTPDTIDPLRPLISNEDLLDQQRAYDAAREEAAKNMHQAYADATAKINSLAFTKD
jgi:hypothetical protein